MLRRISMLFLAMLFGTACFAQTVAGLSTKITNQNGRRRHDIRGAQSYKYLNDSSCVYYDNFENFEKPRFANKISYSIDSSLIVREDVYENMFGTYELYGYDVYKYYDSSANDYNYLKIINCNASNEYYSREICEYDGSKILSYSCELYDENVWKNNIKHQYSYNDNGTIKSIQVCGGDNWDKLYMDSYMYNGMGKIDKIERINSISGLPFSRKVYVYQGDRLEEILTEVYEQENWTPNYRVKLSYDSDNNISERISYRYDAGWVDNFRFTYKYDNSINIDEIYLSARYEDLFDDIFGLFVHPVIEMESYLNDFDGWTKSAVNKYFFIRNTNVSIPAFHGSDEKFVIFPNPNQNGKVKLHFDGVLKEAVVKVFDIRGLCVLNATMQNDLETLDVSQLAPGVYVVELNNGGSRHIRKLTKK